MDHGDELASGALQHLREVCAGYPVGDMIGFVQGFNETNRSLDDQRFFLRDILRWAPSLGCCVAAPWTEYSRSATLKLRRPRRDLIRMDVEPVGNLSQRPTTLDRRKRHLCLEDQYAVPAWLFARATASQLSK